MRSDMSDSSIAMAISIAGPLAAMGVDLRFAWKEDRGEGPSRVL
jgi:hypothetical protein